MIKSILPSLTRAMNAWLNLDPESKHRFSKLHGKAIAIEFLPIHLTIQCCFDENGMQLVQDDTIIADATLRGTPLQMLGVMTDKKNRQRFFAEDLVMEGNAELAQQVVELVDHLQIDWEEYLSAFTGDITAYHAMRLARQFKGWLTSTGKDLSADLTDFLHEEMKWVPAREALNDFFAEIDLTRMDVDRMEARIKNLAMHFTHDEGTQ